MLYTLNVSLWDSLLTYWSFGIVQNIYCKVVFHFIFVLFTWLHLASRNQAFCLMLMHIFASVVFLIGSKFAWSKVEFIFACIRWHIRTCFPIYWIAFFFFFNIVILYWFLYVCSNLRILWPVYLANDKHFFAKYFYC